MNSNNTHNNKQVDRRGTTTARGSSSSAQRRRDHEGLIMMNYSSLKQRRVESPSTPGRPIFGFSAAFAATAAGRKSIPSKWEDAEKWLISGSSSCRQSPAHAFARPLHEQHQPPRIFAQTDEFHLKDGFFSQEKLRLTQEEVISRVADNGLPSSDVFLKDKFTDNVELVFPSLGYSEPTKEGFMFKHSYHETVKESKTDQEHGNNDEVVQRRDVGTEMTPLGSSTTSRCHTPIKSSSPARHNTPANRSGPLVPYDYRGIDLSELKDCHFAKLELSAEYDDTMPSNWNSRDEEEEEISKSLRHFELNGARKSVAECRASAWEDEERTKSCFRYQREEARIQAWVNLQKAKAEAQSRKLEVKIQKMRSNLEEKLMKRMVGVYRKADEWRTSARMQHSQQMLKASQHAQKMRIQHSNSLSACGCFPCNYNTINHQGS